jgi:hypothetical protein
MSPAAVRLEVEGLTTVDLADCHELWRRGAPNAG